MIAMPFGEGLVGTSQDDSRFDKPGVNHLPATIPHPGIGGDGKVGAHGGDQTVAEQDGGVGDHRIGIHPNDAADEGMG